MEPWVWGSVGAFVVVCFGGGLLFVIFTIMKRQVALEVKESQNQFLHLAKQQFETEQARAGTELETRKQAIASDISQLKEELEKYKRMVHDFEQDRQRKYGNLEVELKNATQTTLNLQEVM